ncbi:MAG: hypothetical protein IJ571_03095 [Ruminococcus sp.]|nr:hypothetical protein [Ruminococcus sp.]
MDENRFTYSYSPAKNSEVDRITAKYAEPYTNNDSDLEELKKLDRRAEMPGTFIGIAVGLAGVLILGFGLSLVLSFDHLIAGMVVGILGLVTAGSAAPISKAVTRRSRDKYRDQILELSRKIRSEE